MTDEFSDLNVINLSMLMVILLHGSSITSIGADIPVRNVTENNVAVPSQAAPSPIAEALDGQAGVKLPKSSENHTTLSAMVNLVEAPVEVIGPRVVESGAAGKVERKRESRPGLATSPRDLEFINRYHRCAIIRGRGGAEGSKADGYRENDDRRKSDSMKRDAQSGLFDEEENEEYGNQGSRSSGMKDDEDEYEDDDNAADNRVRDNDKRRRNLGRKGGRNYRQGPKIWDQWGKWTSCSVSCGAGKLTRWRHCVAGGCSLGEKEAQLKTCTFSAC